MHENESGRKFVAKWDESVVVDAYEDGGDYRLVVEKNGAFHILTETTLLLFFTRAPELDPEDRQPHCITCGANLLTTPRSVCTPYECVKCRPS